jgi:hypothetical protein
MQRYHLQTPVLEGFYDRIYCKSMDRRHTYIMYFSQTVLKIIFSS